MKEKILITGGAGFIGSHTAEELKKLGYRVVILDSLVPSVHQGHWPKYIFGKGFELIRGDVRNKRDWLKALRGVSYVYHLAAHQDQRPDFSTFFGVNVHGAALLYEIIVEKKLPIKKIIIASTQFVYGDGRYRCLHNKEFFYPELRSEENFIKKRFCILCKHGQPAKSLSFKEDQLLNPTNAYGLSKVALEQLALRFGKTYGIPTTIFRYSIVQGTHQSPHNLYSGALRIFITQALSGKPITVFENGQQGRDFVNIADVVSANILALKNRKTDFEIYNVGGGRSYKILDFAKLIKRLTNSKSPLKISGYRRTDTRHAVSDISKLKELGWRPKFSPEKSVRDYIDWYRKEFKK